MVTADRIVADRDFRERAAEVLRAGGSEVALHLRSRALTGAEFFGLAVRVADEAQDTGARVVVNDRVDVALAAGIARVHLGSSSVSARDARALLERTAGGSAPSAGPPVVGRSVHGLNELRDSRGIDYFIAGNLHETASHPGRKARGLPWLSAVVRAADRPVVAIGGITPEGVSGAVQAGAHGVAVLSGIWDSGAPGDAVSRYLEALKAASRTSS